MKEIKISEPLEPSIAEITEPIEKYLTKYWDVESLRPHGFDEYDEYKDYCDYVEEVKDDFDGFNDEMSGTPPFPIMLSMPYVGYAATNQSISPLLSLVGACVRHGMAIQQKRDEVRLKNALVCANDILSNYIDDKKTLNLRVQLIGVFYRMDVLPSAEEEEQNEK